MPYRLDSESDRRRFRERYGPSALIAGASEGIGAAFAYELAALGLDLVLTARRPEPLDRLAAELRPRVDVETVALDLGDPAFVERLRPVLGRREIGLLVYNACASTIGEFAHTALDSKLASVDVNCRGPLLAIDAVLPAMRRRRRGGVLLMSSVSGFQGTALVTTYAATKAFTQVLGEGLWEELKGDGIDVCVCAAGATRTPNFDATTPSERRAAAFPMQPAEVARHALRRLDAGPATVAGGLNWAVVQTLRRLLGRRTAVRFMSRSTRSIYQDVGPTSSGGSR